MIPVKGHPELYRDEKTGAILNRDDVSYQNYIQNKNLKEAQKLAQKQEIEQLKKPYSVITGVGQQRIQNALKALCFIKS